MTHAQINQINRAIAKQLGWTRGKTTDQEFAESRVQDIWISPSGKRFIHGIDGPPDFYHDLNACHEMEASLATWKDFPWTDTYGRYVGWLERVTGALLNRNTGSQEWKKLISATAPQRCEAFLKSVGKWPLDITQPAC